MRDSVGMQTYQVNVAGRFPDVGSDKAAGMFPARACPKGVEPPDFLVRRVVLRNSNLWPAFLFCHLENPLCVTNGGFCCQVAAKFFARAKSRRFCCRVGLLVGPSSWFEFRESLDGRVFTSHS